MAKHTFSVGGTDTNSATYGFAAITNEPHQSMPDPNLDVQPRGSTLGGAVTQGVSFKPRFFTWSVVIRGTSPANLAVVMDNLKTLLNPTLGTQLLIASTWTGLSAAVNRGCFAVLNGPINTNPKGDSALILQLNWVCPRPFMVTATAQGQTDVTINADPMAIFEPTGGSNPVLGTHDAQPVITIKNTTGGAISTLTITNSTTGEALTFTGTLQNNEFFRCDTERLHCEFSTDGVTFLNAMASVSSSQDFIHLQAGVNNTFSIAGLSSGLFTIVYRGLFL